MPGQNPGAGIAYSALSYDTALLLFLCLGLAVVLRRRRALRQQLAAAEGGAAGEQDVDALGGLAAEPFVERAWEGPQQRPEQQQAQLQEEREREG